MAAAGDQYFYEDEVYRINKRGHIEFGMVLENSELVSSDENSDREDGGKIKKGHIRVAWHPSGVEEVIHERKVGLADRSLMPGDVVRRMIKGKDTQRGYCRDISVTACVQVVGTKQVIPNVKSEHLVPLEEFAADIAVCLDSWVGGIKMVHSKLHLYLPDAGPGSRCVINELEANGLDEFDEKRDAEGDFPHRSDYYPGQVLYGPLHCLEYANWTHCTKDMKAQRNKPNKTVQVVVEGVETTSVGVHWQCRAYSKDGAGNDKEQPKFLVQGEDLKRLKLLNVFEPCTLQVGDRNYYTVREEDTVISKEQWRRSQRDTFRPYYRDRERGGEHHHHHHHHWRRHPHVHKRSAVNGSTSNSPSGEQNAVKSLSRPAKPSQDMDIMSCQDSKTTDGTQAQPRSKEKEAQLDQGRKKRVIGDTKMSHSRQKLADVALAPSKSSSPTSKRTASGESKVEETSVNNCEGDVDGGSQQTGTEDRGRAFLRVLRNNAVQVVEEGEFEDVDSTSEDTSISSGCSSTGSQGMKKRGPALMTKVLKKKKLRRAKKRAPQVSLEPGTRVVVETLSTSSVADVIWQDGSVEKGIPSTQLYPIHHLDDQEFFPGDFVMENKDENSNMRIYGVIQSVDHAGRTACVKWFKTYTSTEEPQPTLLEENEVSVYDLKDHPDFQYRPGTVVIRVANFEGEDVNCSAGQVLDNYPEGRVRVWWVDGHISMCWPQDLYKVGEYDSEEGELWEDGSSEASWETESEESIAEEMVNEPECDSLKPKLAANIEKARIAMSRLEEIFTHNPALQTTEVMRKLLEVYKDCRYLDKLMNTSFFHEKHFEGLLEKVRERGRANVAQRVADQVSRLFQQHGITASPTAEQDAEAFPELRVAVQMAEQISELVQSHCNAAQVSQKNSFFEKLNEHHISVKKVSHQILQLFQKSLFSRNSSQDKDQCNNEKKESPGSSETRMGGRVLGEIKFNPGDFGNNDSSKSYTLRLRFIQPDENPVTPVKTPSMGTATSPLSVSLASVADSNIYETKYSDSLDVHEESLCKEDKENLPSSGESLPERFSHLENKLSGEFLTESLSNLEKRVTAAAANAASGSTRKLARRMSSILSKFGSVTCELLAGEEVVYSMDLGSGSGSRSRHTQAPSVSPPATATFDVGENPALASATDEETAAFQERLAMDANAVCVRLCSLIKAQLVKAHGEVTRRFGGQQLAMTLSDAANSLSPGVCKEDGTENAASLFSSSGPEFPASPSAASPVTSTVPDSVTSSVTSTGAEFVMTNFEDVSSPLEPLKLLESDINSTDKSEIVTVSESEAAHTIAALEADGGFAIEDEAPNSHKFKLGMFQPIDHQSLYRTVRKEIKLLRSSLPAGIWVKGFEDRMDLYSVMIRGPERTPYEDGLFLFDFQLSQNYPNEPPLCHYISYCSDRLNPNLYEDGKVCVSLLGTWSGKGTEVWSPTSNLLQVIVSIQGLILVSEPYFNEAGYEKQKGSQQGRENSRMYNEMVVLKLVQAMSKLIQHSPAVFEEEIKQHFQQHAARFVERLEKWLEVSDHYNNMHPLSPTSPTSFSDLVGEGLILPEFPLIPASKGFCLTLRKTLSSFREVLSSVGLFARKEETEPSQALLNSSAS